MEIEKRTENKTTRLTIRGRLDAYWADHLSKELNQTIREGAHHFRLDLTGLDYISSAGVRVLVKYNKTLSEMNGSFAVIQASEAVQKVLDLIGLSGILTQKTQVKTDSAGSAAEFRQYEKPGTQYHIYSSPETAEEVLECRLAGNPRLLDGARFSAKDASVISLPPDYYGFGLGCFGKDFDDCQNRFGEFITAAGTTAYLPTDHTNVPDFMTASGTFIPELNLLYGLFFKGNFKHFLRFEAHGEARSVGLSQLCSEILEILGTERAAVTLVAETEGLVGTALRKSPAVQSGSGIPFRYPDIRKWLSFTSERAFQQNTALITGVIDRAPQESLKPFVRPMDKCQDPPLYGHFHASVFPYQPVRIGRLDIGRTVSRLYESGSLQSILHLVNDDREFSGAGESEFIRGACWCAPISEYVTA